MARTLSRLAPAVAGFAVCCGVVLAADAPLRFDLIPKEHLKDGRYQPTKGKVSIPDVARDKVICFCLYTTHRGVLKLNAQLYPLKAGESRTVTLHLDRGDGFKKEAERDVDTEGWRFRTRVLTDFSHRATELRLDPLPREPMDEILANLLPGALDDATGREIVARAEGNPLYMEELLRALLEGGGLDRRHRTWTTSLRHVSRCGCCSIGIRSFRSSPSAGTVPKQSRRCGPTPLTCCSSTSRCQDSMASTCSKRSDRIPFPRSSLPPPTTPMRCGLLNGMRSSTC